MADVQMLMKLHNHDCGKVKDIMIIHMIASPLFYTIFPLKPQC